MWAAIPMLRVRSRGVVLGTISVLAWFPFLPAVVGEGLVGLGHLVRVFLLLHGPAPQVGRVHDLVCRLLLEKKNGALAGEADDPAEGEGGAAGWVQLQRQLS